MDENVFAYSNRNGDERALVVYNNRYGSTHGTVRHLSRLCGQGFGPASAALAVGGTWAQRHDGAIVACRDSLTGLEYLRRAHDVADHGVTLSLNAYQCYVFLDWRELHPTAGKAWDRLCDYLGGRGVSSLDDALINLELKPVHDALRQALDPAVVRMLAEAVEVSHTAGAPSEKKNGKRQSEFLDAAWGRCEELLRPAAAAWARLGGERVDARPLRPDSLVPVYRKYLRDAMRLLAVESIFPGPLPPAARRVLPASSPKVPATALWGPVMAWCLLQVLAEGIDEDDRSQTALHLFDRLRLREPLAHAFNALGLEGEWGWRAAARLKVLLIIQSQVALLGDGCSGTVLVGGTKTGAPCRNPCSQRDAGKPVRAEGTRGTARSHHPARPVAGS